MIQLIVKILLKFFCSRNLCLIITYLFFVLTDCRYSATGTMKSVVVICFVSLIDSLQSAAQTYHQKEYLRSTNNY